MTRSCENFTRLPWLCARSCGRHPKRLINSKEQVADYYASSRQSQHCRRPKGHGDGMNGARGITLVIVSHDAPDRVRRGCAPGFQGEQVESDRFAKIMSENSGPLQKTRAYLRADSQFTQIKLSFLVKKCIIVGYSFSRTSGGTLVKGSFWIGLRAGSQLVIRSSS